MMRVLPQPEPASFDAKVRRRGTVWLERHQIDPNLPPPSGTHLHPYWKKALDDLYTRYGGCCAYLAVYFERVVGGATVDHFVAKSKHAGLAYEWSNYLLACSRMNSRKRDYDDVIDPFEVRDGWFRLELVSGRVYPDPALPRDVGKAVQDTILRLGLDDPANRELRARHFQEYSEGLYTFAFLKARSPFVWAEAQRQGVL